MWKAILKWTFNPLLGVNLVIMLISSFITLKRGEKGRIKKYAVIYILLITLSLIPLPLGKKEIPTPIDPMPVVRNLIIITFDGTRSDRFWQANTTNSKNLARRGVGSTRFYTVYPTITYPAHTSLFTGITPETHKVFENEGDKMKIACMKYQTIFQYLKGKGFKIGVTGGFFLKYTIVGTGADMVKVGMLSPDEAMNNAIEFIEENRNYRFAMAIHLAESDSIAHMYGDSSIQYIRAIEYQDTQVGRLINKLEELNLLNSTLIFITADHGMMGNKHHGVIPICDVMCIPLVVYGPGIRSGYTLQDGLIIDIPETALFLLGYKWTGRDGKTLFAIYDPTVLGINENTLREAWMKVYNAQKGNIEKEYAYYMLKDYLLFLSILAAILMFKRKNHIASPNAFKNSSIR